MKALFVCLAVLLAFRAELTAAPEPPAEVAVMSLNCWHRFTKVNDGLAKAAAAIAQSGADVVGLQECSVEVASQLAEKLGWQRADGARDVQIISRYPVVESYDVPKAEPARAIGAKIRLAPGREIVLFNAHLSADHYGPYAAFVAGATAKSVLAEEEKSKRAGQIAAVLDAMKPHLARANFAPVLLTGDFNVPSHLDWTAATAAAHGGIGPVAWPVSRRVEKAGLLDTFRVLHPDAAAVAGNSWSTLQKDPEPQDRIDFIFYRGSALRPVSSELYATAIEKTIGAWGDDTAPIVDNTWPSDHFAMLTKFAVNGGAKRPNSGTTATAAPRP